MNPSSCIDLMNCLLTHASATHALLILSTLTITTTAKIADTILAQKSRWAVTVSLAS